MVQQSGVGHHPTIKLVITIHWKVLVIMKKPQITRWCYRLTVAIFVIAGAVMAFPQLIGSNDEPTYALAIVLWATAALFYCGTNAWWSSNNLNLIQCPMCLHKVSPEATTCAGCGHTLKEDEREEGSES